MMRINSVKLVILLKLQLFAISFSLHATEQCLKPVDFFDSMACWQSYDSNAAMGDQNTCIVKSFYDQFVLNDCCFSEVPRIPKIIHQIWLGGPLPEVYRVWQQSWQRMNPDWQYMLWTEKEIDEFGLVNRRAYDLVTNLAAKSDIARYEILYRMGGLYVDTDFECLKPFDFLHHCFDFYTGCVDSTTMILLNGLLASRPGHPILKQCIDMIKMSGFSDSCDVVKIMENTGPYMFTRAFFDSLSDDIGNCVVFPVSYFYPFPASLRKKMTDQQQVKKMWVRDESFAIHWWNCSWQK